MATLELLNEVKGQFNVNSIKNFIAGGSVDRGSSFEMIFPWPSLMRLADEKGHFASDIIEKALNGKFISDKQAWVVAFFAKNNGLLK